MPSNIFATTNTNVSILFIDKNKVDEVILIDASKLGTSIKEGKNKKTILENSEEDKIIQTFNTKEEKSRQKFVNEFLGANSNNSAMDNLVKILNLD